MTPVQESVIKGLGMLEYVEIEAAVHSESSGLPDDDDRRALERILAFTFEARANIQWEGKGQPEGWPEVP